MSFKKTLMFIGIIIVGFIAIYIVNTKCQELERTKNISTYVFFPLVDSLTSQLRTSADNLDSEYSYWDDDTLPSAFSDCTNEATEIGSTGIYYLQLTSDETNNDYILVRISADSIKTQSILIRTVAKHQVYVYDINDSVFARAIDSLRVEQLDTSGASVGELQYYIYAIKTFQNDSSINIRNMASLDEFKDSADEWFWEDFTNFYAIGDQDSSTLFYPTSGNCLNDPCSTITWSGDTLLKVIHYEYNNKCKVTKIYTEDR